MHLCFWYTAVGINARFQKGEIILEDKILTGGYKQVIKELKASFAENYYTQLEISYSSKRIQSKVWKDIREVGTAERFKWMKANLTPDKVGQIIRVQEQVIPTRTFIQMQGRPVETTICRLCGKEPEGAIHWMSACEYLAGGEYLQQHNQ